MDFSVTNAIPVLTANVKAALAAGQEESFLGIIAEKLVNTADTQTILLTPSGTPEMEGVGKYAKTNSPETPLAELPVKTADQPVTPPEAKVNAAVEGNSLDGEEKAAGESASASESASPGEETEHGSERAQKRKTNGETVLVPHAAHYRPVDQSPETKPEHAGQIKAEAKPEAQVNSGNEGVGKDPLPGGHPLAASSPEAEQGEEGSKEGKSQKTLTKETAHADVHAGELAAETEKAGDGEKVKNAAPSENKVKEEGTGVEAKSGKENLGAGTTGNKAVKADDGETDAKAAPEGKKPETAMARPIPQPFVEAKETAPSNAPVKSKSERAAEVKSSQEEVRRSSAAGPRVLGKNAFFTDRQVRPLVTGRLPEKAQADTGKSPVFTDGRAFPARAAGLEALSQGLTPFGEAAGDTGSGNTADKALQELIIEAASSGEGETKEAGKSHPVKESAAASLAKPAGFYVKGGKRTEGYRSGAVYEPRSAGRSEILAVSMDVAGDEIEEQPKTMGERGLGNREGALANTGWRLWQNSGTQTKTADGEHLLKAADGGQALKAADGGQALKAAEETVPQAEARETGAKKEASEEKTANSIGGSGLNTAKKTDRPVSDPEKAHKEIFVKTIDFSGPAATEKHDRLVAVESAPMAKTEAPANADLRETSQRPGETPEPDQRMSREVARQVLAGLRVSFLKRGDQAVINLKPENLGKVRIDLMRTDEGITARFRVESQEAKEALGSQITQLKQSMEGRGVNLVGVQVELGNDGSGKSKSGNTPKKKIFQPRFGNVEKEITPVDRAPAAEWSPWGFETRV